MGAYEYLERQKGKMRKCLFFYVKIFEINSMTWVPYIKAPQIVPQLWSCLD